MFSFQVFHICQVGGKQDSFLCANGSIFNQQYFVCDWYYNVNCDDAESFYSLNAAIGQTEEQAASSNSYSSSNGGNGGGNQYGATNNGNGQGGYGGAPNTQYSAPGRG